MKKSPSSQKFALYFRNFIFGVEDSLVSTVGLLSGVAIAGVSRSTIFLTGMVLIFVEGFSMGVGSFLSEDSSEGYLQQKDPSHHLSVRAAIIMFVSYFFAGFIPLAPYVIFEVRPAFYLSIILSLLTLFALGVISGLVSSRKYIRTGFKMMLIGGVAIGLGILIGTLVEIYGPSLLS
jgi:VIT1/CCC1 family predicted Fe2+/Mn2+ transporter